MTRSDDRAHAWVDHLRHGGTTPWARWTGTDHPADAAGVGAAGLTAVVPGAQQLELLRHLNLAARTGTADAVPDRLAERVLTASAPGRGRPDLDLVGAVEPSRFGPRPVDPGDLPLDELVRVATGLLAEDLVARGADLPEPRVDLAGRYRDVPAGPRRPRRWRTPYLLGGDPWLVDAARSHLVGRGRPPGGRDATAIVVGTNVSTMVVDAWTARCFGDGAPPWRQFLADLVDAGRLPPRADVLRAATRWSTRLGPERVVVLLEPGRLPELVGAGRPLPGRPRLAAHATELARQVGPALGLLATPPRSAQLLTEVLLPRLADVPGDALVVPAGRVRWLGRQARRQRRGLAAAGVTVHGDLDLLLPVGQAGVPLPPEDGVLDLAVRLLLEGARGHSGDPGRPLRRLRSRSGGRPRGNLRSRAGERR